jgi:hypothetical protein
MAVPNLSEIVTTTIDNRSKAVADNVSKSHAVLDRLEKKGKAKPADGGRRIVQEIEFAENGTFGWYSGYDPLNITPSEVFSAAEFDWKQCAVAVSISGLEQLMNSGEEQFIDLLEARVNNAERTMKNQMGLAVYGDGTAGGGKAIGGFQLAGGRHGDVRYGRQHQPCQLVVLAQPVVQRGRRLRRRDDDGQRAILHGARVANAGARQRSARSHLR